MAVMATSTAAAATPTRASARAGLRCSQATIPPRVGPGARGRIRRRASPAVRHATYGGRALPCGLAAVAVVMARPASGEHARQVVDRGVARGHRRQAEAVLDGGH